MFINLKALISLPVFTESGARLGRVREVELDTVAHSVRKYIIASGLLGGTRYLVSPVQIKSVTAEKMVVDNTVTPVALGTVKKSKTVAPSFGSVASRSEE